ncbi:MAG: NAD(P)/FAD-dependent oxidoreductase [Aeromicrobium sp.]|jgi:cyclohexanone monooxygenase
MIITEAVAHPHDTHPEHDLVVIGGGMSGIAQVYSAVQRGLSVLALEQGSGVGGTWYWNRYPGARCDTESIDYSFSFSPELQQEWTWSERYPTQGEIEQYLNHVVDRFDLRGHFQFDTTVAAMDWDEVALRWVITTTQGEQVWARNVTLATGMLHIPTLPRIPGVDTFEGRSFHTRNWPTDLDFTGKKVAIVGTGSSGIQTVAPLSHVVEDLYVFQRTANYIVPANQGPIADDEMAEIKRTYPERRKALRASNLGLSLTSTGRSALEDTPEQRAKEYSARWGLGGFHILATYVDLWTNQAANDTACEFVVERMVEQVEDPEIASLLKPPPSVSLGIKRVGIDTDYYSSFNKPNVHLVDAAASPITEITPTGIRTSDGDYDVDIIVYATGFDGVTGSIRNIAITGRDGRTVADEWAEGPSTWYGMMLNGFPNLYMICGPGGPNTAANVPALAELESEWIVDVITTTQVDGVRAVDPLAEEQVAWTARVEETAQMTLFPSHDTWYTGRNVPGKPKIFPTFTLGTATYFDIIEGLVPEGLTGLERLSADTAELPAERTA